MPKGDRGSSDSGNFRPISCPNAVYKICTSYLLNIINRLDVDAQRMHPMQRGVRHGNSGLIETGLLNRWVIEDAIIHKRNIAVAWLDFRKAFDTVSH
ncbi:reverse transcriptase domain-containing protein, partial [Acinetobacter baumannii]|uniref:reverse transcriptase domain-containing protein n=1 Tax=Acinetobacter baumannii TaxID=470 RepID=UPI0033935014